MSIWKKIISYFIVLCILFAYCNQEVIVYATDNTDSDNGGNDESIGIPDDVEYADGMPAVLDDVGDYVEENIIAKSSSPPTISEINVVDSHGWLWPIDKDKNGFPCDYGITSSFGNRKSWYPASPHHHGIDIKAVVDSEVRATRTGTVVYRGTISGYGKVVILKHEVNGNSVYSLYAHLNSYEVEKDATVTQGNLIALSGNTGLSSGAHLHFELFTCSSISSGGKIYSKQVINPNPLLEKEDNDNNNSYYGPYYINPDFYNGVKRLKTLSLQYDTPKQISYKFEPCNHDVIVDGKCQSPDCNYVYKYEDTLNSPIEGEYKIGYYKVVNGWLLNKYTYLRKSPYKSDTNSIKIKSIIFGKEVKVLGYVKNMVSNECQEIWYKAEYNGITGYIYSEHLEFVSPLESEITFSGVKGPGDNCTLGKGQPLYGIVESRYPLAEVRGYLVSASKTIPAEVIFDKTTYSYNIRSTSTSINSQLTVGKMPAGSCYYYLEATDKYGNTFQSNKWNFSIGSAPVCAVPTIQTEDYLGGKKIKISCSTSGATIHYTIGDKSGTSTNTVTMNVTDNTYVKVYATKNGVTSGTDSKNISVNGINPPTITSESTTDGSKVFITSDTNKQIYYSINGGEYSKYQQPFLVYKNSTVTAFARGNGYRDSKEVNEDIIVSLPLSPLLECVDNLDKVALGETITIKWSKSSNASGYNIKVMYGGALITQESITDSNTYVIQTTEPGVYSFSVSAYNNIGESNYSNVVVAEAMLPSTVKFVDFDDTVISEQLVGYDKDAVRPVAPSRTGYTFDGWSATSFTNVKSDVIVKAEYTINTYTVSFNDWDGVVKNTQYINYQDSAVLPDNPTYPIAGFDFIDWRLVEGEGDLDCVLSNQIYEAIYQWGNEDIPVVTEIVSAVRSETNASSYTINLNVYNYSHEAINGKILVNLKTSEDKHLATTMLYVDFEGAAIPEDGETIQPEIKNASVEVIYTGTATIADVALVLIDENDKTGGAFAKTVSKEITSANKWSNWQYEYPEGVTTEIETVTEYRYRTKSTKTSDELLTSDEWELYDTIQSWGNWSDWNETPRTETDTRQVEKKDELESSTTYYRYQRYYSTNCSKGTWSHFCKTCAMALYGGTWTLQYTPWSTTKYPVYSTQRCSHCGTVEIVKIGGRSWYQRSEKIVDNYITLYRYRDAFNTYYYQNWSDWSDWSEEYIASSATCEVETIEKYRYVNNEEPAEEDNSGELYQINGNLNATEKDFSGEYAVIMVYQGTNADPTQSQLQYVGGTTINEDNSYNFSFKTKKPINQDTGDFIVTLGIEGATNLLNIDRIEAPETNYLVKFVDYDGTVLNEQYVTEDSFAVAPENPSREGYQFTKWDKSFTCIKQNMDIIAKYTPKEYAVVFIDWLNGTSELTTQLNGDLLVTPETPSYEGHVFLGWDAIVEGNDTVNGNMIVNALYQANIYNVSFLNENGEVYDIQQIEYGKSAILPEDLTVDNGKVFLGWDNENQWWKVTDNMDVLPIIVYEDNTMSPIVSSGHSNLENIYTSGDFTESDGVQTNTSYYMRSTPDYIYLNAEDNAVTYYTTDGSDPTIQSNVYIEPIFVEETTIIKAMSVTEGKNYSEVVEVRYCYDEYREPADYSDNVKIKSCDAVVKPNKDVVINIDISDNPGLSSYTFFIECDQDAFYIDYDEETNTARYEAGEVSENGEMYVYPWEGKGWQILWVGNEPSTIDGSIFQLTLTACEGAISGIYSINVYYSSTNTIDVNNEEVDLSDASVRIFSMVIDINNDNTVDMLDLVIAASNYGTTNDCSDINYDAVVNLYDLIYISRYME